MASAFGSPARRLRPSTPRPGCSGRPRGRAERRCRAILFGVSALATPDLIKKDTTKCGSLKSRYCTTTCEDSVYTIGLCRDDKTGETSAISVECCCCTEGANHRSFIGG